MPNMHRVPQNTKKVAERYGITLVFTVVNLHACARAYWVNAERRQVGKALKALCAVGVFELPVSCGRF